MSYQLNPLLEGSAYKKYLIDHPEVIKKEVDPIKKALMRKIRHQAIVGKKVSRQISKGPSSFGLWASGPTHDTLGKYIGDGGESYFMKYDIPKSILNDKDAIRSWKFRNLPRYSEPYYGKDSIVSKALGDISERPFVKGSNGFKRNALHYGKYKHHPLLDGPTETKDDALKSGNLDRIISWRYPGEFLQTWKKNHPVHNYW